MVPTQTLENFPIFGDNATKVKPNDDKYSAGFQPADVYPAEWVNYIWNKSSSGVSKLNEGVNMMEQEINNVLNGADKTPDATKNNQLLESIQKLISDAETRAKLAAHPVGSLYWSSQSTDPATLFGGTWARVKDKFILAAGDTYAAGATGGAATVTLNTTQIPSHTHTLNAHTHTLTPAGTIAVKTNPTFTGSEHSHSYTPAGSIAVKTNPTFTGSEHSHSYTPAGTVSNHSHGLNSHTHSVTAAGTVSSHSHGVGTIATTGAGAWKMWQRGISGSNITDQIISADGIPEETKGTAISRVGGTAWYTGQGTTNRVEFNTNKNVAGYIGETTHTHTMSGSTANAQPTFTGSAVTSGGATGSTANAQPTFTGTAATLKATQGGSISGGAYTFTGTAATLKATQGGSISGGAYTFTGTQGTTSGNSGNTSATGGGGAHNNMPPYIAYYCWERTA